METNKNQNLILISFHVIRLEIENTDEKENLSKIIENIQLKHNEELKNIQQFLQTESIEECLIFCYSWFSFGKLFDENDIKKFLHINDLSNESVESIKIINAINNLINKKYLIKIKIENTDKNDINYYYTLNKEIYKAVKSKGDINLSSLKENFDIFQYIEFSNKTFARKTLYSYAFEYEDLKKFNNYLNETLSRYSYFKFSNTNTSNITSVNDKDELNDNNEMYDIEEEMNDKEETINLPSSINDAFSKIYDKVKVINKRFSFIIEYVENNLSEELKVIKEFFNIESTEECIILSLVNKNGFISNTNLEELFRFRNINAVEYLNYLNAIHNLVNKKLLLRRNGSCYFELNKNLIESLKTNQNNFGKNNIETEVIDFHNPIITAIAKIYSGTYFEFRGTFEFSGISKIYPEILIIKKFLNTKSFEECIIMSYIIFSNFRCKQSELNCSNIEHNLISDIIIEHVHPIYDYYNVDEIKTIELLNYYNSIVNLLNKKFLLIMKNQDDKTDDNYYYIPNEYVLKAVKTGQNIDTNKVLQTEININETQKKIEEINFQSPIIIAFAKIYDRVKDSRYDGINKIINDIEENLKEELKIVKQFLKTESAEECLIMAYAFDKSIRRFASKSISDTFKENDIKYFVYPNTTEYIQLKVAINNLLNKKYLLKIIGNSENTYDELNTIKEEKLKLNDELFISAKKGEDIDISNLQKINETSDNIESIEKTNIQNSEDTKFNEINEELEESEELNETNQDKEIIYNNPILIAFSKIYDAVKTTHKYKLESIEKDFFEQIDSIKQFLHSDSIEECLIMSYIVIESIIDNSGKKFYSEMLLEVIKSLVNPKDSIDLLKYFGAIENLLKNLLSKKYLLKKRCEEEEKVYTNNKYYYILNEEILNAVKTGKAIDLNKLQNINKHEVIPTNEEKNNFENPVITAIAKIYDELKYVDNQIKLFVKIHKNFIDESKIIKQFLQTESAEECLIMSYLIFISIERHIIENRFYSFNENVLNSVFKELKDYVSINFSEIINNLISKKYLIRIKDTNNFIVNPYLLKAAKTGQNIESDKLNELAKKFDVLCILFEELFGEESAYKFYLKTFKIYTYTY